MGLTPIVNGTLADATVVNNNFEYLDDQITDANRNITNTQTSIKSYVNSLLSIYQNVNELDTSGTITLADNSINKITPTASVTFSLPNLSSEETPKFHQILVQLSLTDVSFVNVDNLGTTNYFYRIKPSISKTGRYNIVYEYDNSAGNWFVGVVEKGVAL